MKPNSQNPLNNQEAKLKAKFFKINLVIIITGVLLLIILLQFPQLYINMSGQKAINPTIRKNIVNIVAGTNFQYLYVGNVRPDKPVHIIDLKLTQEETGQFLKKSTVVLIRPIKGITDTRLKEITDFVSLYNVKRYAVINFTPTDSFVLQGFLAKYHPQNNVVNIIEKK